MSNQSNLTIIDCLCCWNCILAYSSICDCENSIKKEQK